MFERKWPYMYEDSFRLKWSIIEGLILMNVGWPLRIIDLGCGPVNIINQHIDSDILVKCKYIGIDRNKDVINCLKKKYRNDIDYTFVCANYLKWNPKENLKNEKFNLLLWTGIATTPDKYREALIKYLPSISKGGVVLFDYEATNPKNIFKRIGEKLPLKHLDGCELRLPYLSKTKWKDWEAVNHRIIEVFRKT